MRAPRLCKQVSSAVLQPAKHDLKTVKKYISLSSINDAITHGKIFR